MAVITGASNLTMLVDAVNMHSEDLQGLKADVAVLIDAVLRKDAEADALRAWIAELENRLARLESISYQTVTFTNTPHFVAPDPGFVTPVATGRFVINNTTDGTDDGTTKTYELP